MKKLVTLLTLTLIAVGAVAQKRGAEPTLAQIDSLVVSRYQLYAPKMEAVSTQYQNETDSVRRVKLAEEYDKIQKKCDADLLSIYTKNVKVEGVAERLYSLRFSVSKSQLDKIYAKLPLTTRQNDPFAKSLRAHIDTRQIVVGDTIGDFRATTSRGHQFGYAEFKDEKDMLLIFGDPQSLGFEARLMLQVLYRDVDLSKLEIVSVYPQTTTAEFAQAVDKTKLDWLNVSDFKGVHSPLVIAFGVHTTPMSFYISKGGCVEQITVGIDEEIIERVRKQSVPKRR